MEKLEERTNDWEGIRSLFNESLGLIGIEKQESYRTLKIQLRDYNEKYGTKFDFFSESN